GELAGARFGAEVAHVDDVERGDHVWVVGDRGQRARAGLGERDVELRGEPRRTDIAGRQLDDIADRGIRDRGPGGGTDGLAGDGRVHGRVAAGAARVAVRVDIGRDRADHRAG